MTEPARIPCCIKGCRRTFRPEQCNGAEIMCGRHYRVLPELVQRLRDLNKRLRKIDRLGEKAAARGLSRAVSRLRRDWHTLAMDHNETWEQIKAEAQRQQDAGFFAPRPRRKVPQSTLPPESSSSRKAAQGFEAEFQRMKRAQALGRGAC